MTRVLAATLAAATLFFGCPPPEMMTDVCAGRKAGDLVITEAMIDPEGTDTGGEWVEVFNTLGTPLNMKGLTLYVRDTDGSGAKSHAIRAGTAEARSYFTMGDIRSGANPAWINYSYADGLGSMGNGHGVIGVKCGTTILAEYTYTVGAAPNRSRMLDGLGDPTGVGLPESSYCDSAVTPKYFGNNAGSPGQANPRCPMVVTNTCDETAAGHKPGDLIVTEVMPDPDSTDTGNEWIEIYNTLSTPVDLTGLTLYFQDTDGTGLKKHVIASGLAPSQGYYVFGDVRSGANPAWINDTYGADLGALGNTRGTVGIGCNNSTVTEFTYNFPAKSTRSRMLDGVGAPTVLQASVEANYCDAPLGSIYFGNNNGSPGVANPRCVVEAMNGTCLENGVARPIVAPQSGDLMITEVMAAPAAAADTTGEWIELLARAPVDLNDLTISSTTSSTKLTSMNCINVASGDYVLLARSADTFVNGDLPPPKAVYSGLSLSDTNNQRIYLGRGDSGIDEISIFASSSGKSWQLDANKLDPGSNDDPNNFCKAFQKWHLDGGGDYGSPGAFNYPCPVLDAGTDAGSAPMGQCIDPVSTLPRDIRAPPLGDLVITEWMANPNAVSDSNGEYFEVLAKSDCDLNGVAVQVGTSKTFLNSTNCLPVTANSYLVFGKNTVAAQNGNLPALTAVFTGGLTDSAQTLTVLGADGGIHDVVAYVGSTTGASTQVSHDFENATDNDNVLHQCTTPTDHRYGLLAADGGLTGDRGTPGQANVVCP